jgi:hypothetical protein
VDFSKVLCYFVGFSFVYWQFGEFQHGVTAVTWIAAKFCGILLDFPSCKGSLVNFNKVSLQLRGFQPSVIEFYWILPWVMAVW